VSPNDFVIAFVARRGVRVACAEPLGELSVSLIIGASMTA
jgi:hypothetical protein